MKIPLVDLKAQYESIKGEIREPLDRVLESGQYVLGEEVEAFEREFAEFCGVPHAVALNSCTSALHLALIACGVGPGDEVITAPNTFIATCHAIAYTGACPVFVDVEPDSRNIDPSKLEAAITASTKAIIPVHLYGMPAELGPILEIAKRHKLPVIEDAAQANGALYKGLRVGSFGCVGCFSFYPSKNLGAYGEGGMLVTKDFAIAEQARRLRLYGTSSRHHHDEIGYNYKLDALQAALLRVKLNHLENWNNSRQKHAELYNELFVSSGIETPCELNDRTSVHHLYVVRIKDRDAVIDRLKSSGIGYGLHYPIPCHLQKPSRELGYREGDFPIAEALSRECLSLPMYPELKEEQIQEVVAVVRS